ncbi:hypothetical protein PR048_007009 [Dryococelus australis]|uniref:SH3 domain-containing protein n=1 Tax=Dryococelus australis TaxID=614101 RepID=A0ABQ9ICF4_9NEOP|nr:hypothetical protein PR048_007009 [Dryococelus australis]
MRVQSSLCTQNMSSSVWLFLSLCTKKNIQIRNVIRGVNSGSQIVPETCLAMYEVLKGDYVKVLQTEGDWLTIEKDF